MPLPSSLLEKIEQHSCFSGCFGADREAAICIDPQQPASEALFIACQDCLGFKAGVLATLLPTGVTSLNLADEATRHLRKMRGYTLSVGGYHTQGPGFWLSAVYVAGPGFFLLDGAHSRQHGSDLDLLMLAFRHGVLRPTHGAMPDPAQYALETVYVNFTGAKGAFASKRQFLASPHVRMQPKAGYHRVTLAEFLPVSRHATKIVRRPALKPGDTCPVCNAIVKERMLFQQTFVGCLC